MKTSLLILALSSTFIFAQLQYAGGDFSATSLKITAQDTIYAGNYRSFDNGVNWTEIFSGSGSLENYFSSAVGLIEKDDSLYHTSDYGDTWSPVAYLQDVERVEYSDKQSVLYAYTLYNYMDGTAIKPVSHLYKSSDEGNSWSELTLPYEVFEGDSLACQNMNVLSEDTILFAMRAAGPSYTLPTYLFSSYDGGTTWDTTSMEFHTVSSMEFIDADNGYFAGLNLFYKTSDAGLTWEPQELCPEIKDLDFVNTSVGFVSGINTASCTATTLKTEDGGLTWEELTNCTPCDGLTNFKGWAVAAIDENNMFISGVQCPGVYQYQGLSCVELSVPEEVLKPLSIFPNPSVYGQSILISNDNSETMNIEIYNLLGERVNIGIIPSKGYINMNGLKSGTYVIRLENGKAIRSQKFIVS